MAAEGKEPIYQRFPRPRLVFMSVMRTLGYCAFYHFTAPPDALSSPQRFRQTFKVRTYALFQPARASPSLLFVPHTHRRRQGPPLLDHVTLWPACHPFPKSRTHPVQLETYVLPPSHYTHAHTHTHTHTHVFTATTAHGRLAPAYRRTVPRLTSGRLPSLLYKCAQRCGTGTRFHCCSRQRCVCRAHTHRQQHTHTHTHTHLYMHVYASTQRQQHAHACINARTRTHTHTKAIVCTHTHVHTQTSMQTNAVAFAHTDTHTTYPYTYARGSPLPGCVRVPRSRDSFRAARRGRRLALSRLCGRRCGTAHPPM
jgi:hypothetical protein